MFLNANSHFLEGTKARIIFSSFLQIQLRIVRIALETNVMLSDITKTQGVNVKDDWSKNGSLRDS